MSFPDPRRYDRLAWGLLVVIGLFRLWLATRFPLTADEAYYWQWSKHPDWCYFSKGPLVAWTIWLGTHLLGDTVIGVRAPAVALHVATGGILFVLARRMWGSVTAFWTVLVALLVPLFAVGGILMTIDPISVFFWGAAALAAWRAWETDAWGAWLLAGAFVGLGFLAKFTNAVQGICLGMFLVLVPTGRMRLRTLRPWAAAGVALLLTLPFWLWNAAHRGVTFGHLQHRGALDKPFQLDGGEFFQFLGLQAVVMSPLLWLGLFLAAGATLWEVRQTREARRLFLLSQFLPLFAFFAVFAFNDAGQPNWTVPGYLTAMILAVHWWRQRAPSSALVRGAMRVAVLLSVVMTLLLHDTRWLKLGPKTDPMTRLRGGSELARQTREAAQANGCPLVLTSHYGMAAQLRWEWRHDPGAPAVFPARNPDLTQNQFDLWPGYESFAGERVLFVTTRRWDKEPLDRMSRDMAKIAPRFVREQFGALTITGPPFWITDGGRPVGVYQFVVGTGLSPAPGPAK